MDRALPVITPPWMSTRLPIGELLKEVTSPPKKPETSVIELRSLA